MLMDVVSFRSSPRLGCLLVAAAAGLVASTPALAGYPLEQQIFASDGSSADEFGISVGADGDVVIVGAHMDGDLGNDAGAAFIYRYNGVNWVEEQKLHASDGQPLDRFGYSVDIEGNTAIIGAAWEDTSGADAGAVYVFRRHLSSGQWIQEAKLLSGDGSGGDQMGFSVSLSGNTILAGAYGESSIVSYGGAAYVFRFNGSSWVQDQKLVAGDVAVNEFFGSSVALNGDVAMIGKYGDAGNGSTSGSAYVFRYNGSSWVQEQKLVPPDVDASDLFGASVAASGNYVVAGALQDDDTDVNAGAAYVFRFTGSGWVQDQKLVASNGTSWDKFGRSVAVEDNVIVVGAWWDDQDFITDTGSAYVFTRIGNQWVEQANMFDETGWFDDNFGGSVAVANGHVVVASHKDDNQGNNSGSIFVFDGTGDIGPDCNNNGVSDGDDIAGGTSEDCNVDGIPDECQTLPDCDQDGTPDGCEVDCNDDGIPDECQVLADCDDNGTPDECENFVDCNGNDIPDACETLVDCNNDGTPDICQSLADCNSNGVPDVCEPELDCNGNGTPDECESLPDCNQNGTPDTCDIASGSSNDNNQDGIPDDCQFEDCNKNGVSDATDILLGFSEDCNGNDIPDECEGEGTFNVSSGVLGPIGNGSPQSFETPAPPASDLVSFAFLAQADLSAPLEYVDVAVNGTVVARLFEVGGVDCADPPNQAGFTMTASDYNAATVGGTLEVTMTASAHVSPVLCGDGYIVATVTYAIEGLADLNGNGIPDVCENGVCTADITSDGAVDVEDIVEVIVGWGDCPPAGPCRPDINFDGEVDVNDLVLVMEQWGCTD